MLERFLALCTWQHPRKTLFFCFGLLMAYVVCCLIPNRLLVAAVISKMFLGGLMKRLRYGNKVIRKGHKARDAAQIMAENFLSSLPTAPQREVAARHKRLVRAQQHKRELRSGSSGLELRVPRDVHGPVCVSRESIGQGSERSGRCRWVGGRDAKKGVGVGFLCGRYGLAHRVAVVG